MQPAAWLPLSSGLLQGSMITTALVVIMLVAHQHIRVWVLVRCAHLQQESGQVAVRRVLAVVVAELAAHALHRPVVRDLASVGGNAVDPGVANLQHCPAYESYWGRELTSGAETAAVTTALQAVQCLYMP